VLHRRAALVADPIVVIGHVILGGDLAGVERAAGADHRRDATVGRVARTASDAHEVALVAQPGVALGATQTRQPRRRRGAWRHRALVPCRLTGRNPDATRDGRRDPAGPGSAR